MTLSGKIKSIQKKYVLINGDEISFGAILVELAESDYPVKVNAWSEDQAVKALDELVKYWLESRAAIKKR